MRSKSNRNFPTAGGLTSRREVLRHGAAIAAVSALAPSFPRFARAQTATTFEYYISPTGSDSNTGSISSPWAITSLQANHGNNAKIAGKRVGLLPGTYHIGGMESGSNPGNYSYSVLSPPFGAAGSPTYIGSSDSNGNYSPRTATIQWTDSGGGLANCNGGLIGPEYVPSNYSGSTPGYITIDGLIIDCGNSSGGHAVQVMSDYGNGGMYENSSVTAPVAIIIQNCEIRNIAATDVGNNDAFIFFRGCNGGIVQNCYLHDISKPSQSDHAHAIEEYGSQNCQYIYNTVVRCTGGIESKGGCAGTVVAYNYITASQFAALMGFDGATGNPNKPNTPYSIHHNILDGNVGGAGAPCLTGDQNIALNYQDINYYNNTIYDSRSGSQQEVRLGTTGGATVTFYNNIICTPALTGGGGSAHPGIVNLSSGGYTTVDYNCYYMAGFNLGMDGSTYSSLSAWQSATRADLHSWVQQPGFVGSITSGNGPAQFKLAAAAALVAAGQGGLNVGAWDGKVTQIGCNFAPGSVSGTQTVDPNAPVLITVS
jgi:hypothetical protein